MTSDTKMLLKVLKLTPNEWVGNLYSLNICVHSRVSDIRRMGYRVDCKRFGQRDYRYKLVPFAAVGGPVV